MYYYRIQHPLAAHSGVYLIRNLKSGRVYVGGTEQPFHKRWRAHLQLLRRGVHTCADLQADWRRSRRFEFDVIEVVSGSSLREREQFAIDRLRAEGVLLYNSIAALALIHRQPPSDDDLYSALYARLPDPL